MVFKPAYKQYNPYPKHKISIYDNPHNSRHDSSGGSNDKKTERKKVAPATSNHNRLFQVFYNLQPFDTYFEPEAHNKFMDGQLQEKQFNELR